MTDPIVYNIRFKHPPEVLEALLENGGFIELSSGHRVYMKPWLSKAEQQALRAALRLYFDKYGHQSLQEAIDAVIEEAA